LLANKCSKAVLITFIVFLTFPLLGLEVSAGNLTNPILISLKFANLQVSTENGFTALKMDDCSSSREVGKPVLPARNLTVAVPPGTEARKVTVTRSEWYRLPGTYNVEWGHLPATRAGELPESVSRDKKTYSSNNPYPAHQAKQKTTGRMRKISLGNIRVNPVVLGSPLLRHLHTGRVKVGMGVIL
jgi:hypothetical protein